jgi:two-component system chemotaxis sensor kinase CheA
MESAVEVNPGVLPAAPAEDPMRKIIIMVGVAIVVFLAFIIYSVSMSVGNNARLSAIKDLYFPVLERVDANIVRLDNIVEHLTGAVMTGEKEELDNVAEFAKNADVAFGEMAERYPERKDEIGRLQQDFKIYHGLGAKNSLAFMDGGGAPPADMAAMNEALKKLRADIKVFRDSSYENFVATLQQSQSSGKVGMWLGIFVGIMNLGFMGVLVFFIRNNVKMMATIAEQNANLEHRVNERTAELAQKTNDINAMLHNMKLGVCTVVPGNRIHPEYSSYMKTIFSTDELGDKDVMEGLFTKSKLGVDSKDQINVALGAIVGEDAMMFDFNGHLLATEMQVAEENGHTKILQMDWSPIINEHDVVDKVLLIVQDVTHLRELELESAHQKEELDIIAQIIKISIGKFNDFIGSAHKFVAENRKLLETTSKRDTDVIAALFRNMHTIKGNARTFEFVFITNAAHAAETEYDRLRKDPEAVWNSEQMLTELQAVEEAIERYVVINEDKLGRKGRASDLLTTRGAFVSNDEITLLKTLVVDIVKRDAAEDVRQLQKTVGQLGLIPLQRLVSGSVDSLSSLAKELEKPTPSVDIVDGDIAFNNMFAEALKSSFMHIVRNSMDHGIEGPDARVKAGKPEQGQLRFACVNVDGQMTLQISDDGRGLALHKLYEKGLAAGRFEESVKPTPAQVAELIFASGLSTAEAVTQVSGRGVGMDAVRAFLQEQGAGVHIVLDNPSAEFGFTPFRFVIDLPPQAYNH